MTGQEWFLFLMLGIGATASLSFFVAYAATASLKSRVARQILILNGTIAIALTLSAVHQLDVIDEDIIYTLHGFNFIFINFAIIYQFINLYRAKKEYEEE